MVSHRSLDWIISRYHNLSTDFQFLVWLLNNIVSKFLFISRNAVVLVSQLESFPPRLVCVYHQNDDVAPTSSSTSRYINNQQIHINNQQLKSTLTLQLNFKLPPVASYSMPGFTAGRDFNPSGGAPGGG
ncbi:hypothetical protein F511_28732 [Dorcoceras hygrometricum]|uniref:Uncharacterized protein n=1 Tax=Dorcoceras hygrometricum TaxID=472368 RepID=A0A2Z7C5I4_9LAMI|nr:hypothetical protein F511_28732 [Dorcoceras hygrometricum]